MLYLESVYHLEMKMFNKCNISIINKQKESSETRSQHNLWQYRESIKELQDLES